MWAETEAIRSKFTNFLSESDQSNQSKLLKRYISSQYQQYFR